MNRFSGIPHHLDTNLLERCQEEIRNFDINYKGWVEPRDHTISYLAAAYLELAKEYEALVNSQYIEHLSSLPSAGDLAEEAAARSFEESVFQAQMETLDNLDKISQDE